MQPDRKTRVSTLSAAMLAAALTSPLAFASGGDPTVVRLVSTSHVQPEPEAIQGYLQGHLGILWPEYDPAFLLMAYRQAGGLRPLSDADAKRVLAPKGNPPQGAAPYGVSGKAQATWTEARKQLGLAELPYRVSAGWREQGGFMYSDNCQPGAFVMAAQTLTDRMREHDKAPAALKQWVAAQDSVFSWCETSGGGGVAMPALADDAPAWLAKDRAYQAAAMLLYQQKLEEAARAFDAIAADAASPWREWAGYLAVRVWWRQHFNAPEDYHKFVADTPDWAAHPMARRLKQLEASAKDPAVAQAATGLYNAMATRYSPKSAYEAVWRRMDGKAPIDDIPAWVADVRWLWALLKASDYPDDWLLATRSVVSWGSVNTEATTRLIDLAKARRDRPIWLASAMMAVTPETPGLLPLVDATRKTKPGEPLYMHFAWHRARLALASRDYIAARAELAAVQPLLKDESLGTRQAFDQLQMIAAPSFDELSRHLVRTAVGTDAIGNGYDSTLDGNLPAAKRENLLDMETRNWMVAQLSGKELLQLARDTRLPAPVRLDIAGEAWRWGAWLPDAVLEREAATTWAELAGKASVSSAAAGGDMDAVRFQMARALLLGEVSRVQQFDYDVRPRGYPQAPEGEPKTTTHWRTPPSFHDTVRQRQQVAEMAVLATLNETNWMGKQILPWMRANPKFAEGPAILEKLVYASRYGTRDTPTSRQAFQLLHQHYPKSPEALRTKYFF